MVVGAQIEDMNMLHIRFITNSNKMMMNCLVLKLQRLVSGVRGNDDWWDSVDYI